MLSSRLGSSLRLNFDVSRSNRELKIGFGVSSCYLLVGVNRVV